MDRFDDNSKTFVANRIVEIQRISSNFIWQLESSLGNPADMISRGIETKNLINDHFWWSGPDWLRKNIEHWPTNNKKCEIE